MHEENKQWKKYLAHPFFLWSFGIAVFIAILLLINFSLNGLILLGQTLKNIKNSAIGFEGALDIFLASFNFSLLKFNFSLRYSGLVYLIGLVVAVYFGATRAYRMRIAYKDINKGTKGTERFTTPTEVKEQYLSAPLSDQSYQGQSGIPVYRIGNRVFYDEDNTNSLLLGATQSGKTQLFSYPMLDLIMRAEIQDSVIINDLKGDMYRNTKKEFEEKGYKVLALNLIQPEYSIRYNPLRLIQDAYFQGDLSKAQMLTSSFAYTIYDNPHSKDKTWDNLAISLVSAAILYLCELAKQENKPEYVTIYSVYTLINELGSTPASSGDKSNLTQLHELFAELPKGNIAKNLFGGIATSSDAQFSSILITALPKLLTYTYDNIAQLTASSDFDFIELSEGDKPIALFIIFPDWDTSNYDILSLFLSQLTQVLSERATLSASSKLDRRVRFLLEEIGNLPEVKGLSQSMNVGNQRGIVYHLVLQSNSQLDDVYGKEKAEAIRSACGNQIFIMSDEMDDAEDFSKKIGSKTIITGDRHGDPMSIDKSFGEREEERSLLTPNELLRLKFGEWVVFRAKKRIDLQGNDIESHSLFASKEEDTFMLPAFKYLKDRFASHETVAEIHRNSPRETLDLSTLLPDDFTITYEEEKKTETSDTTKKKEDKKQKKKDEKLSPQAEKIEEVKTEQEYLPISEGLTKKGFEKVKEAVRKYCNQGQVVILSDYTSMEQIDNFLESHKIEALTREVKAIIAEDRMEEIEL